jgi:MFS transporter, OPA family, glycerol-3-phosphate transporter
VVNWIPTYLETTKASRSSGRASDGHCNEYAAIPGTVAVRVDVGQGVQGPRAPATLFMALTLAAVVVYWLNPHGPLWIDYAALIAIGFLICGPS